MAFFEITATDPRTRARRGRIATRRGWVATPAFMPVGTAGAVKAVERADLEGLGYEILLANAYHLFLRPGHETIRSLGGLHRFMNWPGAILTDSGGFQVFSLAALRRLDDEGVEFASHLDGTRFRLTPSLSAGIQAALGSDLVMPLDDCPPYPAERRRVEEAVRRTTLWARRSRETPLGDGQRRFGIVQGGVHSDLRARSSGEIAAIGFDGYAVGGVGVGEPPGLVQEIVAATTAALPTSAPRYVMGVGTPAQIVAMIGEGVDLFDCVLPTRNARNGMLFTSRGRVAIKRSEYREDPLPPDPDCGCPVCRNYSRAYLRHLFVSHEILASRFNTLHNLAYYASVIRRAREAIAAGSYAAFRALPEFSPDAASAEEAPRRD